MASALPGVESITRNFSRKKSTRKPRRVSELALPSPEQALPNVPPAQPSPTRPESATLPRFPVSAELNKCHFYAIQHHGNTVQYWLLVDNALTGGPGEQNLPSGHWDTMVNMAKDVKQKGLEQLLTGWYSLRGHEGDREAERT